MKFNSWYNRVRMSMDLDKRSVSQIMRLGGVECSISEIEGWQRRENDARRHRTMTEQQFDAFTNGLVEWTRN